MPSTYLKKSALSSVDSTKIFTFSSWVKKAVTGSANATIFIHEQEATHTEKLEFKFNNSDKFYYGWYDGTNEYAGTSNAAYRDTNGWYHIVLRVDTTQSTAADRLRVYINGDEITSWSSQTLPALNAVLDLSTHPMHYGVYVSSATPSKKNYFDGSMAHLHYCDGYSYAPTEFGETDSTTGIWKPKTSPSVSYGTGGHFIDFASSSDMGNDISGNNNDFTVNGTMTQTIDTPSNVFATMNPLQLPFATGTTFSFGNTKVSGNNADWQRVFATLGATKGKWFYEFKNLHDNTNSGECRIGWDSIDFINMGTDNYYSGLNIDRGGLLRGGLSGVSAYSPNEVQMTAAYSGGNFSYTSGDILGMAIDLDNETFSVYKNGNLEINAYSYASLSNNSISKSRGYYIAPSFNWYSNASDNNRSCFNFGNGYFETTAVSSAGTNSGIGTFEYDVPSGYKALCTKNINAEEYS